MSDILAQIIPQIDAAMLQRQRTVIAVAGPPASGKSTLAESICEHYGQAAVLLPMDGFHLDNSVLDKRGIRTRKGAPETFNARGFVALVRQVVASEAVYAPTFNRSLDLSVANVVEIKHQPLVVVEGNYLLLNQSPWTDLLAYWHLAFYLDVPLSVIESRCIKRWLHYGMDEQAATKRAKENDVRNAEFVQQHLISQNDYPWIQVTSEEH